MVSGSRLLKESKTDRSLLRELISQSYSFLVRTLLKSKVKDFQCGFKAFTHEVWQTIATLSSDSSWFLDTELIIFAEHLGYQILEIPIDWRSDRFSKRPSRVNIFKASLELWRKIFELRRKLKN